MAAGMASLASVTRPFSVPVVRWQRRQALVVMEAKPGSEQDPFAPGRVSQAAADKSRSAVPRSVFNQAGGGGKGNKVLEAFKKADKEGATTKFGQPLVPSNIFKEPKRTAEEIEADAFKFTISKDAIFLVLSFVSITAVMLGTVVVVWKLGGIHYDEY